MVVLNQVARSRRIAKDMFDSVMGDKGLRKLGFAYTLLNGKTNFFIKCTVFTLL